ncbi:unnamed protein product [Fraxinus pennsylvanica]|uniref:Uncharacterized protein n=1 Tax=Fraxinus pennsylvanica TaxID=56036 RepID=A0AAD1ZJ96_9LAMI|nr:unnamed protein product [Fraxinus pennsylvanica]
MVYSGPCAVGIPGGEENQGSREESSSTARELIEEVCDELAKEIGEDKAEVEAVRRESMKFLEEVEEERKMLQMAEVWREERVQMKLVDVKVMLEEKYSQMNMLIAFSHALLRSLQAVGDLGSRNFRSVDSKRKGRVEFSGERRVRLQPHRRR